MRGGIIMDFPRNFVARHHLRQNRVRAALPYAHTNTHERCCKESRGQLAGGCERSEEESGIMIFQVSVGLKRTKYIGEERERGIGCAKEEEEEAVGVFSDK